MAFQDPQTVCRTLGGTGHGPQVFSQHLSRLLRPEPRTEPALPSCSRADPCSPAARSLRSARSSRSARPHCDPTPACQTGALGCSPRIGAGACLRAETSTVMSTHKICGPFLQPPHQAGGYSGCGSDATVFLL